VLQAAGERERGRGRAGERERGREGAHSDSTDRPRDNVPPLSNFTGPTPRHESLRSHHRAPPPPFGKPPVRHASPRPLSSPQASGAPPSPQEAFPRRAKARAAQRAPAPSQGQGQRKGRGRSAALALGGPLPAPFSARHCSCRTHGPSTFLRVAYLSITRGRPPGGQGEGARGGASARRPRREKAGTHPGVNPGLYPGVHQRSPGLLAAPFSGLP